MDDLTHSGAFRAGGALAGGAAKQIVPACMDIQATAALAAALL